MLDTTQEIIYCVKNPKYFCGKDDRIEAMKNFLSKKYGIAKEYYTDSMISNTLKNAFYDYIQSTNCLRGTVVELFKYLEPEYNLYPKANLAQAIIRVFYNCEVNEKAKDGTYFPVNGFTTHVNEYANKIEAEYNKKQEAKKRKKK